MGELTKVPRVLSDIDNGVSIGITELCVQFYRQRKAQFGPIKEAWLFFGDEDAAARGFIGRPLKGSTPSSYEYPWGVLINSKGEQMWLHGVMCGTGGEGARGARTILRDAGFDVPDSIAGYAEMHFINGQFATGRSKGEDPIQFDPTPINLPGRHLLQGPDLVKLIHLAPDDTPDQIVGLWSILVDDWIDELRFLTFFTTTDYSVQARYRGFQLIAQDDRNREIWVNFPLPYVHRGASSAKEPAPESASWTAQAIDRIFRKVDPAFNISRDTRSWWTRTFSREKQAPLIQWISPNENREYLAPTLGN